MSARRALASLTFVALALVPATVAANTPEDVAGVGARTIAAGGAGTAFAGDATAVYYNPANLTRCPGNALMLDVRRDRHDLRVDGSLAAKPVADDTRVTVGSCSQGPAGLAFGIVLGSGLGNALATRQTTIEATPQFVLEGDLQQQLTIIMGAAYALSPRLSLGVGLSVLTNTTQVISAEVPLLAGAQAEVSASIDIQLDPVAAPYAGLSYAATDALRLGLAYRSPLFHRLEAPALVSANLAGVVIDVNLLLEDVSWFSPRSLAFGATYTRGALTVAGDVTWAQWSAYPGPFITVGPGPGGGVADTLPYPLAEDAGFRDVIISRVGLEHTVAGDTALRAGLSFKPAIVGTPRGRGNLLDTSVTAISGGAGHTWVLDRGGTTRLALDAFARVRLLSSGERDDSPATTYRFGGSILDGGVTATLSWE